MNGMHLTEDQLDDFLIGDLAPEPAAHLSACEHCMARVAKAEAPLGSFREMSLAWGERHSATLPTPVPQSPRGFTRIHWLSGAVGIITAAVLLTIALPATSNDASIQTAAVHPRAAAPASPAIATVQPVVAPETLAVLGHTGIKSVTPVAASPGQIDRDNQMLQAISRELDAPRENDNFGLVAAARGQ